MPAHLAYLATGRADIRAQALYAAYSALAWRADAAVELHVFTDAPEAFAPLAGAVSLEPLSDERVRAWCEPFDFVFRLKPKLVEHLLARFPEEKVLLVDADTFFTGPIGAVLERIGPRRAALHEREYLLSGSSERSRFHENLEGRMRRARFRGAPVKLDAWMWNSGLIGLEPSHRPLVAEWLRFVDEVYPRNPKPVVEQYGLSVVLQERGDEIAETRDVVHHYYLDKRRYQAAVEAELAALAALPLEAALDRVRRAPPRVEGPVPRYPKPPRLQRWRQSVRTRWTIVRGLLRRPGGLAPG
jgi:hypothetical protein